VPFVAFTKRVQSNSVTEYYIGEQLFYCYHSLIEKLMHPDGPDRPSDKRERLTIFHPAAADLVFAFEFIFPL
jgi:hypothetical protein